MSKHGFKVVVMLIEQGPSFSAEARVWKEIPARDRSEAFDIALEQTDSLRLTRNLRGGSFIKAHIQEVN